MIRALCAKSLSDAKWLLVPFALLMFFFPWIYIWATSMINMPAFSQFLSNALPKQWERVSGMSFAQMATPAGRIALVYAHPLIMLSATVWAVARGSDCVSGEIGRGTMEMLLAQPVRRTTVYTTQALVTIFGSAILAIVAWCGTATGLATVHMPQPIFATIYLPPALNLFGLMVCLGGLSAFASSWDSQRWRTVGLMGACYVVSAILDVASRVSERWEWLGYASFFRAYKPQTLVAHASEAWSLLDYENGAVVGLGLAGYQFVLFGIGLLAYTAGALIFSRREIPAPL
jgi:ABC-2 type transport system permease protein